MEETTGFISFVSCKVMRCLEYLSCDVEESAKESGTRTSDVLLKHLLTSQLEMLELTNIFTYLLTYHGIYAQLTHRYLSHSTTTNVFYFIHSNHSNGT